MRKSTILMMLAAAMITIGSATADLVVEPEDRTPTMTEQVSWKGVVVLSAVGGLFVLVAGGAGFGIYLLRKSRD